ncbi:MAG: hypothetical protein H0W88_04245 [Parachlamydiaceae bacterium]|nr:hypothetical protein [Parachlamydiaceae bacterium]
MTPTTGRAPEGKNFTEMTLKRRNKSNNNSPYIKTAIVSAAVFVSAAFVVALSCDLDENRNWGCFDSWKAISRLMSFHDFFK